MTSTRITFHIAAPPPAVYRAMLDPEAIPRWRVPDGMRCTVHEFEPREGGRFRVSLTHDAPTGTGKTSDHTDTYHGHFAELVENEKLVEVVEFETDDPGMKGEMTIVTSLVEVVGGTEIRASHESLPPAVSAADNELGWRMALAKLKALLETPAPGS